MRQKKEFGSAMGENLVIVPEALDDIAEAIDWYEGRNAGLGDELLNRVSSCIESIHRNPERYAFVHETYRRALVKKFPYAIFYELSEDTVPIYSVFHCSRDPEKWRGRVP